MTKTAIKSAVKRTARFALLLMLSLGIFLAWLCICVGSGTSDRGDEPELMEGLEKCREN